LNTNFESVVDVVKQNPKLVAADDYELVCQNRESYFKHFKNGEPVDESKTALWWVQIRVVQRKSLGVASTVLCDPGELSLLVDRALDLASNTAVDPWFRFPLWKAQPDFLNGVQNASGSSFVFDQEFLKSLYPQLNKAPVALEEKYTHQLDNRLIIRKSEKTSRQGSSEVKKFHFGIVNENPSGFFQLEETRAHSAPFKAKEIFFDKLMNKANRLTTGSASSNTPRGRYILSGQVMASLLKTLANDLSGAYVVRGRSKFSNNLSERLFSDQITIIDSGVLTGGEGSQSFDLEGTASQETVLMEKGILKTFLHDASTAARYNRASTANMVFSDSKIPVIGVTNLYIKPSQTSLFTLFKTMGDGFYLESIEKVAKDLTRDGKLELVGHGWRVKDGDPVEPITQAFFKFDPIEIFKEIKMVSEDLDFWGRFGAPSVLLEEMPLSDV